MKLLSVFVILLFSTVSFAGEKYICKQITANSWDDKVTMVLTQIGDEQIKEGVSYKFKLELFSGRSATPKFSETVIVETEDVMFSFVNKAKKVNGMIYLDELDQTWLYVGQDKYDFDCN